MLVIEGMQHKLSNPWKSSYDTEYSSMDDADIDSTNTSISNGIGSMKSESIVSGLLSKTNVYESRLSNVEGMKNLEHKIQELRGEKEAGELKTCLSSFHNDQDSPLDFSVKRRSSFSGSLTDDSQASSSSPGHMTDYNAGSPPNNDYPSDIIKRESPSPTDMDAQKMSESAKFGSGLNPVPPLLNGMNMFPGLQPNVMAQGSVINAFSQLAAAALMEPRSKKNSRPFKAYPKEALQMPLGFLGLPGMSPAMFQQSVESGLFTGMNSEELLNMYNQQLQMFRDKQSATSSHSGKSSPTSQAHSPNPVHNQPPQNHQHHQQQQAPNHQHLHSQPSHRHPSPSSISQQSHSSLSPPQGTPDHLKPSNTSSSPFPIPVSSASLNATMVSSTSSYSHTSSRKRPRSLPDEQKDAAYWERRRKNNDAAKRSRDARRAKEDEIAIRAAMLEQENLKLRVEVAALKTETARLRCLLYNS
ncbi:uncharacterized protein LOC131940795 isoform X2 [Physella acuta]|uniref:uncharacterized protein LOC131940795 isoform X2 n=1 Tax=Physella acuta TaxID=109671 RepID=UPI0027DB515A|nr:uncharacterized protein LOC131940795 isoform X2 [Physella acuta]